MKKTISIILAILMIVGTMPFALAVEEEAGTDFIDAAMTPEELKAAVDAALAAGYTAITVNLAEDADTEMFTALRTALAESTAPDGSINLTISGAKTVPEYGFFDYDNNDKNIAGDKLKSLTLTDVETIGEYAFSACTYLESVNLPQVVTIGECAFNEWKKGTKLTSLNLPNATTIGDWAFAYSSLLTSVNLPKVVTIGTVAFADCDLRTLDLPEATTIGGEAFMNNDNIVSCSAPKATTIGYYPWGSNGTSKLERLELTAAGDFTLSNNLFAYTPTEQIDLLLNKDKETQVTQNEDGTATWATTNQYGDSLTYTFKSITLTCVDGTTNHTYQYTDMSNGTHKAECTVEGCGFYKYEAHTPDAEGYTDNENGTHSFTCTACQTAVTEAHTGGTATCTTLAVCDTCGVSYGAVDTTNHDSSVECENGFCPNGCYEPAILNAAGYYEIDNAGKLFWFAQQVNVKGNREIKGVLTANIDLENKPWTPIGVTGEENNNFRGVFDGQNYTIKGLYVEGSENGVGFFGEVRTGTVENFTIYGNVVVNTEVDYVGGVIGSICGVNGETDLERNDAIIQNITSFVNVTAMAHGIGMIGGFVGYANHQSLIEQCAWYGTFDAGEYRVVSGAGGFIGKIQENTSEVTIRNCGAYGTIKTNYAGDYNNYATIYMGGFLSFSNTGAQTTLENCLFAGRFERGENLTDQAFLGAFGTLRSVNAIKNCYYLGDDGLAAVHSDSDLKPGSDNVEITSVTGEELRNNTIATQLGDHWMQDVHYPIPKDTKAHSDSATYTYTDNGDGTHKATCTECGYVEVDNEAHTYENGKCTAEGCGYACTHENNKDENGICTVCCIADGTCGENVTWVYDSKTTTLTISGSGAMADYKGYDMPWYNYQSNITEVVIENGVTTIGEFAFDYCSFLTSVTIPESVTSIGNSAFAKCTSLAAVTIGEGVTTIGEYAFRGCNSLTTLTIGNKVSTIGDSAFEECAGLESVTIPDSVTTISGLAFLNCSNLTSVTIPKNVTTIGRYAFDGCAALISINVDGANTTYSSVDGVLFNADKTELICYPAGKTETSYTVPESVTTIGEGAFKACTALTSVTIGEGVTVIDYYAFYGCSKLASVKIGNGVTKIYDDAFEGCNNLSTVNVPCNWNTENPPYAFDENVLEKYHNIVIDEAKAPTCTATGLTEGQHCTRCDDKTVAQEVVPALNHKGTLVQVEAKAKTCTTVGWEAYEYCTACDYTTKVEIPASHEIVKVNAKAKTCTEAGHNAHEYCTACDYTTKVEIPASHELQEVKAKAQTCEAIGWDAYKYCTDCNYTTYVEKAKLGHDIVIDKAVAPTCTKTGLTEGSHCTRCNDKTVKQNVIPTKAHTEVTVTGKAATCTATGLTDGKKCSVCGTTTVAQQTIAKKGHTEVTVTGKAATCTATGLTDGKKCSVCNTVTKAQETIKAKGHTTSVINKIDATCTMDGYTGDTYCSVCKTTTVKGKTIAKLGHSYNAGEITIKATCEKDGVKTFTCTRCKATKTETIKATGHKEVVIPAVAPTYTTVGKTEGKKCSVCGTITVAQKDVAKLTLAVPTVTIKNTAKGINVSWNKVNGAESYIVYRRTYNGKTKKWSSWSRLKTGVTATSYTDTTVKLGTKYRYTVKSVNGDVASKYISTSTLKYNVAPTVKVANASNGVKVSWSTVANATGYTVYSSTYNTKTKKWSGWKNRGTAKATATSWVDKNATKSGAYYKYTVRACNGKDIKSSYNKDGVKTLFLATPTVKIANNAKGVKVTWNKITGSKGYIIYRLEINNGKWSNWKNMGTVKNTILSWVDKNAQSGTTYRYTVRAVNGNYKSAYKASGSLIFLSQPTVKVANASNGIKVSWNKVDGVTGYTVYSSTYDAKTKKWSSWKNRGTAKANKTSWVDKNVKSGVKYKYTVRAVNGKTRSTYVSSSALLYLAQPTVTVKATSNGINVSWTQCAGSNGYTVYRSELVNGEWSNWTNMGTAKSDKKSWTDKKAKKGVTYKYTVRAVNGKVKSSYKSSSSITK